MKKERSGALVGTLAITLIFMVSAILWALSTREIPTGNIQPLNIVLGGVIAWTGSVIHYVVGSSSGSKDKTAAMAAELQQDDHG